MGLGYEGVFYGVVVDVIEVALEVLFVADLMLPESALPDGGFGAFLS